MEDTALQTPNTQEIQPDDKETNQVQAFPPKPKKRSGFKTFVILITLIGLGVCGYFVWKNFFVPDTEKNEKIIVSETTVPGEENTEEEVFIYKGIWMPTLLLQDSNYLASNIQKFKDLGINTIFIAALPPLDDSDYKVIKEFFSSELVERLKEIIPIEKELLISTIQTAHRNGLKVALTVGDPPDKENVDMDVLNSRIVEVAKLAEKHNVELFSPLNEPEMIFSKGVGVWRQEILHKVKEVYHGEVTWNGAMPGFPDKESVPKTSDQPPGDYAGYDYIGFGTMMLSSQTLEEFSASVSGALNHMLAVAERDGCRGVIITEFGVLNSVSLSQHDTARAYEIPLEKGAGKVFGFFPFRFNFLEVDIPGTYYKENLITQDVIKRYFTEVL